MIFNYNIMNLMCNFLSEHGYIKFNRFLWGKNIKTEIITGNIILVDLLNQKMTMMKIKDSFLWIKTKPKIELKNIQYNTIVEFKRNILQNESTQKIFFEKQKAWKNKK